MEPSLCADFDGVTYLLKDRVYPGVLLLTLIAGGLVLSVKGSFWTQVLSLAENSIGPVFGGLIVSLQIYG